VTASFRPCKILIAARIALSGAASVRERFLIDAITHLRHARIAIGRRMRKGSALLPALIVSFAACGGSSDAGVTDQDAGTQPVADASPKDGGSKDATIPPSQDGASPETDGAIGDDTSDSGQDSGPSARKIKTVFVILMENHNWDSITGGNAPYIKTLLPQSSYCDNYFDNPKKIHPSEPNYIWIESGDNLGITNDDDSERIALAQADGSPREPAHRQRRHLEVVPGGHARRPMRHEEHGQVRREAQPDGLLHRRRGRIPPSNTNATCIQHVRPYKELAGDLTANKVAQYNFITPNLCHDMHDVFGCAHLDSVQNGDEWLATEVPKILASPAFKDDGALFITWDESESGEHPIGMIALSPLAKGGGYVSKTNYFHSSLLRTVEEIFGVPLLRDAQNQPSLADLFNTYP